MLVALPNAAQAPEPRPHRRLETQPGLFFRSKRLERVQDGILIKHGADSAPANYLQTSCLKAHRSAGMQRIFAALTSKHLKSGPPKLAHPEVSNKMSESLGLNRDAGSEWALDTRQREPELEQRERIP